MQIVLKLMVEGQRVNSVHSKVQFVYSSKLAIQVEIRGQHKYIIWDLRVYEKRGLRNVMVGNMYLNRLKAWDERWRAPTRIQVMRHSSSV